MVSAVFSYNSVINNLQKRMDSISKEAVVNRETKYFEEHAGKIETVDEFLNDSRMFNYAMKAFGLEELSYAKGMIRKILTDKDYADRLTDPRFATFRKAFDFESKEEITVLSAVKETVGKYKQLTLEEDVGEQNAGARLAIYFDRRIAELQKEGNWTEITWAYALLGDKALAQTVRTGLNMSGNGPIEAQKKFVESKLSFKELSTPEGRDKFIKRFLALYDMKNETVSSPALNVLQSATSMYNSKGTLSGSMLLSLQNVRSRY